MSKLTAQSTAVGATGPRGLVAQRVEVELLVETARVRNQSPCMVESASAILRICGKFLVTCSPVHLYAKCLKVWRHDTSPIRNFLLIDFFAPQRPRNCWKRSKKVSFEQVQRSDRLMDAFAISVSYKFIAGDF